MSALTLVDLFEESIRERPRPDLFQWKKDGKWVQMSSQEAHRVVQEVAEGLASLGISAGDRVAILSENRVEWALGDQAILRRGALVVTIYPTLLPAQIAYILRDSGSVAVLCSDAEQVEKVESIRANCPELKHVVCFSPVDRAGVYAWDQLREIGSVQLERHPEDAQAQGRNIPPEATATLIYTSGTTGDPKGVMLSHQNIVANVQSALQVFDLGPGDKVLSFLPLSHIFERMAGYYTMQHAGVGIAYAESIETVAADMGEIQPTVMVSVPRLYEKIYSRVLGMAIAGSPVKRGIFFWAKGVGEKWVAKKVAGERVPWHLALEKSVAEALVFKKLQKRTGGCLRFFISGGAPLAKEIAEFFFSAGLIIYEGYGLTETSPVITANTSEHFRPGTVGHPMPGVEVQLAEDGEILTRSASVMQGYWNRPDATAEAIVNGWFHTGDIGHIDSDGFLHITDRKKDLIVTAGGKNVAPQPIENQLKLSRYITEVCLVGDQRKYIVALIVPTLENLDEYCRRNELSFEGPQQILASSQILGLYQHLVDKVNADRPNYEQVKYFRLLDREFTQDDGELTPSLKVKRRVIQERYRNLIEEMYENE